MPRKSQRISSGSAATSKHKRAASSTLPTEVGSKRTKATPTKSQYFAAGGTGDEASTGNEESGLEEPLSSEDEDVASEFGQSDQQSASEDQDDENDYDSASDEAPKKRSKGTGSKSKASATVTGKKGGELWRQGVKAGLGPGTQVVIKKPRARPAGNTPYQDDAIHPNTFLFLKDLKRNNDREWLKMHDPDFRQAEKDWFSFVEKLTEKLTEIDDSVPELPVKDVIFRIYRDIRFSKGKSAPYRHICFAGN
ncbi:uncharacterized protein LTR77_000372 [Saxophila tyrrhenica]|uniref:Uncharacterized protein n=1 Tax=Saxophila tyrrhenica TaxID=1690608 RepID=A0AAV9PSB9_9PEZI|nr:hypothetical protein LTR77_000372 [Saxophila tyrrhenica]